MQTAVYTDIPTPGQRAAAGATWLDEVEPNWFKKIKVSDLDIGSHRTCIIAQLDKGVFNLSWLVARGAPTDGTPPVDGTRHDDEPLLEFGLMHGFRLNYGSDREELTVAWATEIAARKERVKAAKSEASE